MAPFLLNLAPKKAKFRKKQLDRGMDSNNISIGIHFFKVLVQIHYSRSPPSPYFGYFGGCGTKFRNFGIDFGDSN